MINTSINDNRLCEQAKPLSVVLAMVCFYIFLIIERPWESIRYLEGFPIERIFAIIMIIVAFMCDRFKIISSPTNKWVYGLLLLHFILAPFAFNAGHAVDQGTEYAKMVVLYLLMLSVSDDGESLNIMVKAFVFSMMIYVIHSLWEYHNGRMVWRMGISRMVGVDKTYSDPNSFGASVVLSLPFVYTLFRYELRPWLRKSYFVYFVLAVVCVVLTGSRSASVALVFLLILWSILQKGERKIKIMAFVFTSLIILWFNIPAEKQMRLRTIWDENAGPANAQKSADGRVHGLEAGWKMFKDAPFTGVGAGGKNFIGYRISRLDGIPEQAHNLFGEILGEFGAGGILLFAGLVVAMVRCCLTTRSYMVKMENVETFSHALAGAIFVSIVLLLLLGLAGHNFYRPMWLWLAAWTGGLMRLMDKPVSIVIAEKE